MKKKELAVGDSTEIELIYHSRGHKGRINKAARISTSDSAIAQVSIRFTAEAGGYPDPSFALNVIPPVLDFTAVEGKKRTKMSAQIKNVSDERLKIKAVSYAKDLFKIRLSDSDLKPGERTKLMVKLNRRANLDKFEKSITFELNDKEKTRFSIPVKKMPVAHRELPQRPAAGKTKGK